MNFFIIIVSIIATITVLTGVCLLITVNKVGEYYIKIENNKNEW